MHCLLSILCAAAALVGCTTMAAITNPREQPCRQNFAAALADILVAEGEETARAQQLMGKAGLLGSVFDYGPRPFSVSSQTGTDYSFFVEKKGDDCVLRLYGRQKGFTRYTNNLTYIESRNLTGCQCHE
ncbi:hypothetical protein YTPLAS18_00080 [Nitrospira sp.]|nr:hypothetical protein YTPLAS18_00080 [Nitrospira sp.]